MRLLRRTIEVLKKQGPREVAVKAGWTVRNACIQLGQRSRAPALRRHLARGLPRTVDGVLDFLWSPAAGLIKPAQIRAEFESLLRLAFATPPRRVMEIGTYNGGSLCAFTALAADDADIISLDLPGGHFLGGYSEWKGSLYRDFARPGQKMHLVRADSHDPASLARVKDIRAGEQLDFLLVDGDHSYEGVKLDHKMYGPLVRPGGVIVFHDIANPLPEVGLAVARYWNEIKSGLDHREFVHRDDALGMVGIGAAMVR